MDSTFDRELLQRGLEYARSLEFTDDQYKEAIKLVDKRFNTNDLLIALLDVSSRATNNNNNNKDITTNNHSSLLNNYSDHNHEQPKLDNETKSPKQQQHQPQNLKKIYIDGCNVARTHSRQGAEGVFSWNRLKICVDWFRSRNHEVKVFVPEHLCLSADGSTLDYLRDELVETPDNCNDDFFILQAARHNNGIIVSNDRFREEISRGDLGLKSYVHLNRLPYVFVDDLFIPAQDPHGRGGPTLNEFLNRSWKAPHHLGSKSLDPCKYKSQLQTKGASGGGRSRTEFRRTRSYNV